MDTTNDTNLPSDTSWLNDPNAQAVCRVMMDAGYRALFVGGCVRNALLGHPDSDVDISTDARPDVVMELAQSAGFKALPTGIEHGTVTIIVEGKPFEVTTFRRDVATDGRRAVVAFSADIAEDAVRRDFTMNALYTTPAGRLIDPLGGLPDLVARRIRFIENPNARIQEDYLRILRFFRFFAWFGDAQAGFDSDALDAIAQNCDGLETLSAERVGQEVRKLLAAPDPAFALAGMRSTGVLQMLLPGADDKWVGVIAHMESALGLASDWLRRLAVLGGQDVAGRLRLSKAEMRAYTLAQEVGYGAMPLVEIAYRHGSNAAQTALMFRAAMAEQPPDAGLLTSINAAENVVFPIKAVDLIDQFQGLALGKKLDELEQIWIASGFSLKKAELLNHG